MAWHIAAGLGPVGQGMAVKAGLGESRMGGAGLGVAGVARPG